MFPVTRCDMITLRKLSGMARGRIDRMKGWKRAAAGIAAAVMLAAGLPQEALAANAWLDRARDDNAQQLLLLEEKRPEDYLYLITPDPVKRQILAVAAQGMTAGCRTDEEKVEAVYSWVTENTYYDWDGLNSGNLAPVDPYSVLTNHYAVCEGYATLLAELLNSVGIPCVTFHGASCSANPGATRDDDSLWTEAEYNEVDHAWNAVYTGGEWRYYDPTWDSANARHQGVFLTGAATLDYYAMEAGEFGNGHRSAYRINDSGGFRLTNGKWLRYEENGTLTTGLAIDYYDRSLYAYQNGLPVTGKAIVDYQLASFTDSGRYLETCYDYTGWFRYDGNWYYIMDGITCYGWGKIDGKWYYMDGETCRMQTGWRKIDGKWYYFSASGAMQTGWVRTGGKWYYLAGSGAMATGWQLVCGKWYYLNSSGAMQTGWVQVSGKWYYLYADGSMAANTVIDGYQLNAQGTY